MKKGNSKYQAITTHTSSHKWTAVILLTAFLIAVLRIPYFQPLTAHASPGPQPVGEIAVETIGIPAGTISGSQLSWTFNGFVANATSTSSTCTSNLTQTLSADANKTVSADTITTLLSKVYADDDDPYHVSAVNETENLYWLAKFEMNVTLDNHYIADESWITGLDLTIKGNSSLTPDTNANVYLYNFTDASWVDLGTALNGTSKATLTYTIPSGKEGQFVDEGHSNAVWLNFTWYDSTNTDFDVDVDYLKLDATYNLTLTVGNWATTQTNSTVTVTTAGAYTVNYWENCTLSALSGVTDHNFTVYRKPPDKTLLTDQQAYVNNTSVLTTTVPNGEVSFNVTNLVNNSTDLNFNAEDMVKVSYPQVTSRIKTWEYADSLYSGLWAVEANVTNSFSELEAENVNLTLQDFPATHKLEVHRTAASWTMYLDGTETTPDSSTLGVSLTHKVSVITPSEKKNFTLVEKLQWAFVYNKTEGDILTSSYSEPMKLTFNIQGTGAKNVTVWCELEPYSVTFNGTEQDSGVWSYTRPFLKMEVPLSTKEVVVRTLAPWLVGPVSANHRETVSGTGTVDVTAAADTKVKYDTADGVMIDVARYESNPGTAFGGDIGKYIDVHLNSSTVVNQIEIRLYYTDEEVPEAGNPKREEELRMYWWDGTSWTTCSNTGVNTAQNYVWANITSTTTPNLSDLTGTPFGASSPEYPVGGTFGSIPRLSLLAKLAGQFIVGHWPMLTGISMLILEIFTLLHWRKK